MDRPGDRVGSRSRRPRAAVGRSAPLSDHPALRGRIVFTSPPDIELNGDPARLSPGVRIHNFNNMMIMTGAVAGSDHKYVVDYTVESTGLDLRGLVADDGRGRTYRPWPRNTTAQAAAWTFDYMAQTWTKP